MDPISFIKKFAQLFMHKVTFQKRIKSYRQYPCRLVVKGAVFLGSSKTHLSHTEINGAK